MGLKCFEQLLYFYLKVKLYHFCSHIFKQMMFKECGVQSYFMLDIFHLELCAPTVIYNIHLAAYLTNKF